MVRVINKILMVGLLGALMTGCAGIELGGKVGLYEVETRDTQETVTTRAKPFVCRFRQCDPAGNVIQGS